VMQISMASMFMFHVLLYRGERALVASLRVSAGPQ
jgi:hypothetical protein